MTDSEKLKIYTAMSETTRKWIPVMDTKAGFISTLNAGLIAFIWTSAKLIDSGCLVRIFAMSATIFSLISLFLALRVVLPRATLRHVFGCNAAYIEDFKPISFYGFVADYYPKGEDGRFISDVKKFDEAMLIDEALEQHFTISHVVQTKSKFIAIAGISLQISLLLIIAALFTKEFL